MQYQAELCFFQKLLKHFHLNLRIIKEPFGPLPELDFGLRHLLNPDTDYLKEFENLTRICRPNKIYRIHDEFFCRYLFFALPDCEKISYVLIGPYTDKPVSGSLIAKTSRQFLLPLSLLSQLELYYQMLPVITNEYPLLTALNVLGECIWGGMDSFSMYEIEKSIPSDYEPVAKRPSAKETEDAFYSMKFLEERYQKENMLIHAVSKGQIHKAEMFLDSLSFQSLEVRSESPVQNAKNYSIILNTLLRKAAENGAVHPLHIDSLSSRFAKKIEALTSQEAARSLQKEMAHKYCLMVKNHSMKGYSLLVRKVLTRIDSDLTADLSLKTQAELLKVNSSYLSTLFKKETGCTLTEYVNRKRMEHAIFLLNTTDMQIQEIAVHCGITDVNYFTKIFKKQVGCTPKEYRERIMPCHP